MQSLRFAPRASVMPISVQEEQWCYYLLADRLLRGQSSMLERLSHARLTPTVLSTVIRCNGGVDVAAMAAAVAELVDDHEILRTRYIQQGVGAFGRRIEASAAVSLEVLTETSERSVVPAADGVTLHPWEGPVIRASIIQSGPEQHIVRLDLHHIVADAWSLNILGGLLRGYYAWRMGVGPKPDRPRVQYADYAAAQRAAWDAGGQASTLDYWRSILQRGVPIPALSVDSADLDNPARRLSSHMTQSLTVSARQVGAMAGVSLFMVLLTAYAAWLYLLSGQPAVGMVTPTANRTHELKSMLGLFATLIPIRVDIDPRDDFTVLARKVRSAALAAYEYPFAPIGHLWRELLTAIPDWVGTRSPISLQYLSWRPTSDRVGPTTVEQMLPINHIPNGIAVMFYHDQTGALASVWQNDSPAIGPMALQRLAQGFGDILECWVGQPERRVEDLRSLLSSSQASAGAS